MTYLGAPRPGRRRGDVAIAGILVLLGGFVSSLSREQQNQVEAFVRATALYPFLHLHRASAERSAVGRRLADLQRERDSLVQTVVRYRALADQSADLRDIAALASPRVGEVRAAEVYPGRPRVGDPDVFVLRGPGLSDLVFPVGVFTGSGLVGVARGAHGAGARGDFWSHPDFRVSVVTEDGVVSGIVRPLRRDGEEPILLLDGAPFQSDIAPGTRLLTTGIAGVYPPGITVGSVRQLAEEEAGWMKRYYVEPAVRPAQTALVLVWVRPRLDSLAVPDLLGGRGLPLDSLAAARPPAPLPETASGPDVPAPAAAVADTAR